jgi:hypothetical protein
MHLRVLLRAVCWFAGTFLVTLMFYPIIYGGGWTGNNPSMFAARLLVPALLIGGLSLVHDSLFSNDSTLPR